MNSQKAYNAANKSCTGPEILNKIKGPKFSKTGTEVRHLSKVFESAKHPGGAPIDLCWEDTKSKHCLVKQTPGTSQLQ